ncbi:MAG: fumarate hydratase C-terminal domain-containing protein [Tannerellaceae bacterium]|nr:fumarate hydratase C-terminal domain-containing protein [Tannerellaceae bacterium]
MKNIKTPIEEDKISELQVGDMISISGYIYTGRDAVLPKIVSLIQCGKISEYNIQLQGSVIFHTAVSPAGVGPTSSNKFEIESSIPVLSSAGVKLHLGKGALRKETVESLKQCNSVYAVIPPVTALLKSKTLQQKIVAFPGEGMEAFHILEVHEYPAIVAVANGKSIYDEA